MATTQEEVKIRLGVDASAINSGLNGVVGSFSNLVRQVGGVFAGSWAAGKFMELFDQLDQRIDNIKRTSEKSGLDTGFVQDLMNIGKLAGIGGDQIEGMLDSFARRLKPGENPAEKLRELADNLAKTTDAGERAAMAIDAFGKAGVKMIPILSQGSEAIDKLAASMGKLSADQIQQIDELNDRLDIAKSKAQVWFAQILQGGLNLFKFLKSNSSFLDRMFLWAWLPSEDFKNKWRKFWEDEGEASVKAANDAFDQQQRDKAAAIKAEHDAQLRAAGDADAWLQKKDRERTFKRAKDIEKLKMLEQELADLRGDYGNMESNTAQERAEALNAIRDKENEIADLKSKMPAGPWKAFAGDPRKEAMASYYDKLGQSLGPTYGKVFKDRAASLRDAEQRTLADGTIQKRMIGEAFFDAMEKTKTTPQSVIIKGVEGE